MMLRKSPPEVVVLSAAPEDALACGQICYYAFSTINGAHGFPCDFPASEASTGLLSMMFSRPDFFCVVAEVDGRTMGSNCLDERSVIRGVGSAAACGDRIHPLIAPQEYARLFRNIVIEYGLLFLTSLEKKGVSLKAHQTP
jgi:hypothetical protein